MWVIDIAFFNKGLESIAFQHGGPDIAVIARSIATLKRVLEIAWTVAHHDFGNGADTTQNLLFPSIHIGWGWAFDHVHLHIHNGSHHKLTGRPALIEVFGRNDFINQSLGNHFARGMVLGKAGQDFRRRHPMLHQLAWKLNKVTLHIGARLAGIGHV